MQARYYDPVIGRFYSNDPVGFTGDITTFNRYSYVGNNPYAYTDPDGRSRKPKDKSGLATANIIARVVVKFTDDGSAINEHAKQVILLTDQAITPRQKSRAKRRAARAAQRKKTNPPVAVSQPGTNVQGNRHGEVNLRGQKKKGMDGKTEIGIQDGSKDRNNDADHKPAVDVGNLKEGVQPGSNGQPRIKNEDKVKEDI